MGVCLNIFMGMMMSMGIIFSAALVCECIAQDEPATAVIWGVCMFMFLLLAVVWSKS